jgi:cytochrome c oxidase subunit IV
MHMEGKKSALRYAVVLPVIFLIMYLLFILLTEGNYIYEVLKLRRLSGIFNNILIHNKVRFAPFFLLHFK